MRRRALHGIRLLGVGALLACGATACRTPSASPVGAPMRPVSRLVPIVPDDLDHAAADLAVATLAADPDAVVRSLGALEVAERRAGEGEAPTGLVAAGHEAASAVLHPGRAGRAATEVLLARDDLDAASRERLERGLADDPLVLARERIGDARFVSVARLFNSVSEPVGRSVFHAALLPYTLGRALADYSLDLVEEDPLPLRRRQALAHWQTFRRRYPDAPEVAELAAEIEAYEAKRRETLYANALGQGEDALDDGLPDYALLYARRALRHEESEEARELLAEAQGRIDARHRALASAQGFDAAAPVPTGADERTLVLASLSNGPSPDVATAPRLASLSDALGPILAAAPETADAAPDRRFAAVLALGRAGGDDVAMWTALEVLRDESESPMARHAGALLRDPERHPHGAFERARSAERRRTAAWLLLGPLAARPEADAVGATRYLLDLPLRVQGAALLPIRLLTWPWRGPTPGDVETAVHARRYLALHPDGAHADEVREWLLDFERGRENWVGALRVAEGSPDVDDAERDALREAAAEQALGVASAEERRDLRAGLLANVARTFPETRAGREAGRLAREQAEERTTHEILLSRGFLLENRPVAGPAGLDLAPELLDGDARNGELHPDGVVLAGGRDVVVHVLAASGDEDDPPEKLRTRVSPERLARLVARLEETSFRNALLDADDALVPDAQRDDLFERARLGLADAVDERPGAEARFAYRGLRERYGMVRSREAILPVELVLQGSLADLTLGAFPRLRPPRETPDAVLYR